MAMARNQKLSPQQETWPAQWAIVQQSLGLPVTYEDIRDIGHKVAKAARKTDTVGGYWMDSFLERDPEVRSGRGWLRLRKRELRVRLQLGLVLRVW